MRFIYALILSAWLDKTISIYIFETKTITNFFFILNIFIKI